MVLSILLKQCRANAFSSPEFQLLLQQSASYVFRWTKGIYRCTSTGSRSCTNRTRSGYFHALIYTGLSYIFFVSKVFLTRTAFPCWFHQPVIAEYTFLYVLNYSLPEMMADPHTCVMTHLLCITSCYNQHITSWLIPIRAYCHIFCA